jgi:chromosome segregation ATPase
MTIHELRDRVLTLPALEKRMSNLRTEILNASQEVSRLLRQYEQESRDVEIIRKESFSAFLFKLIGKYEDKLEKEQREEIDAKLEYDRAAMHLDSLERERDELGARITSLQADNKTYQAQLAQRRNELAGQYSGPESTKYAELEDERKTIISQITEVNQALGAAYRVRSTAQSALESLKSAEGWATYDAFTRGGIISHVAKYSHIDDAERCFHTLSSQIRNLKSELKDVHGLTTSGLSEISSGQRAVDFWFDNIFTDLSVRSKVRDNADQVNDLLRSVNSVESSLKSKLRQMESELQKNKQREEELLISL